MPPSRLVLLAAALCLPLALAACDDDEPAPAPESWAPLHYEYLTKLRLNVGSIEVQDHSAPQGDNDVSAQSPVPPAQATAQLAHDRLFAAGLTGTAVFVIDQANIVRNGDGVLNGAVSVHLDILNTSGADVARAEMHVGRQHIPGSDPENLRNVLYGMTRSMMDDLNVELEYQIRRSMSAYLVTTDATPAKVLSAPLQSPGAPMATPLAPPGLAAPPYATPPAAPPPADMGLPPAAPLPEQGPGDQPAPPEQMSPPPGFLQLPPAGQPQQQ